MPRCIAVCRWRCLWHVPGPFPWALSLHRRRCPSALHPLVPSLSWPGPPLPPHTPSLSLGRLYQLYQRRPPDLFHCSVSGPQCVCWGGVKQRILSYHMTPVTQVIGHRQQHCPAALCVCGGGGGGTSPPSLQAQASRRGGGGGGLTHRRPHIRHRVLCFVDQDPPTRVRQLAAGLQGVAANGRGSELQKGQVCRPLLWLPPRLFSQPSPRLHTVIRETRSGCSAPVQSGHTLVNTQYKATGSPHPPWGCTVRCAVRCAKSRLFSTTGSHGSHGPDPCTLQHLLVLMFATGPRVLNSAPL